MEKKTRKRASQTISLVLISSVLASCGKQEQPVAVNNNVQKVYMRADTSAPYQDVTNQYNNSEHHRSYRTGMSPLLWYMAFRHMGGGLGYSSSHLNASAVAGRNVAKSNAMNVSRGGFGSSSRSVGG